MSLASAINRVLEPFNARIGRLRDWRQAEDDAAAARRLRFLQAVAPGGLQRIDEVLALMERSPSQLLQDVFVLLELGFRQGGYFVEFGATDGLHLSNTFLLEKSFGWRGVLAEPARRWHDDLKKNRSAAIDTRCVWKASGETLSFRQTRNPDLSTLEAFRDGDFYGRVRRGGISYDVATVSLTELLNEHHAPEVIDYLSIDTEGSELDILAAHDFDRYRFRVITCEHNYAPARERIHELLRSKGYVRRLDAVSHVDDWYVLDDVDRPGAGAAAPQI